MYEFQLIGEYQIQTLTGIPKGASLEYLAQILSYQYNKQVVMVREINKEN